MTNAAKPLIGRITIKNIIKTTILALTAMLCFGGPYERE
jgi:hypothetical protein